jgi:glyoxylase-like metal-dependent hydrolase (beta-lactamase superfamily II)
MERLPLSNSAFEGDNNAYLFETTETVLVDTGDWMETTREQFESHLAERGLSFADVDRVILTHWHPDHTGLAGEIQAAGGATVHVHADDALLVEGDEAAWAEMHDHQEQYFEDWAMPEEKRAVLRETMAAPEIGGRAPDVDPFEDGDVFSVGDVDLEIVHTSGHADGLSLVEFDGERGREVLSGDTLLPVYTPNVGGADVRVDRPLARYLDALRGIIAADYARAWPGHREPIDDPAGRASDIIHHHEERAWRVLDTLRRLGPCTVWEVSAKLFGELDGIHVLHGPGEAYAHLDHLQREGTVIADGTTYRLADGVAGELAALSVERWDLSA